MTRLILCCVFTSTLAAGCYDPELGDTPFKCAVLGQECPDGYKCDAKSKVCIPEDVKLDAGRAEAKPPSDADDQPSKEGFVYLDGHPVKPGQNCLDEASEPNNSGDTATPIPSPGMIPDWQICYPGDVDHFVVDLDMGVKLVAKIKFFHKNGDLDAALVDPTGFVIAQSRSDDDDEELTISAVAKKGKYIIGVYGFGDATNSYNLDLAF